MTFVETGLDIHLERMLDVTPQQAYDAWVDNAGRGSWYTPYEGWSVDAEGDVRVDGKWSVRFGPTPDEIYTEEGEYLEVDPPHKLVYTNTFTFPDGRSFTTLNVVMFEAVNGGTRLVIEDRGYPSAEQRDGHQQGWPSFLDMFERHLATL